MTQRIKEPEKWVESLDLPAGGTSGVVTERELERDEQSFMAFAAAFGVQPPSPAPAKV